MNYEEEKILFVFQIHKENRIREVLFLRSCMSHGSRFFFFFTTLENGVRNLSVSLPIG